MNKYTNRKQEVRSKQYNENVAKTVLKNKL